MKTIVFIDDEHGPMDLYVQALRESGYAVDHFDTVQRALEHIDNTQISASLYILDLMMPPGKALSLEQSGYGLTSGIQLFIHLRRKWPEVPVIILTGASPAILAFLPHDSNTTRESKIDLLPFELADKVLKRIGRS